MRTKIQLKYYSKVIAINTIKNKNNFLFIYVVYVHSIKYIQCANVVQSIGMI